LPDNVTVLYRGARYELGRGPGFYGIWLTGAPQSQPFEWWHETPEGWYGAWHRLTTIETPGTIMPAGAAPQPGPATQAGPVTQPGATTQPGPVTQPGAVTQPGPITAAGPVTQPGQPSYGQPGQARARTSTQAITASALLAGGVMAGLIGLFPSYVGGQSLAAVASNLVPHVIYLLAWLAAAVLLLLGGGRQRAGALLAAGVSVVTLGLFLADLGTVMSGGAHLLGGGLVLSFLGWLLATAGAVMALWLPPVSWPARPRGSGQLLTLGLATVIAIGAAIAFAPSWDSFTVREANGTLHHFTAGNAFANPGPVIAADVIVMILFVAVVVVAALWRPVREGAVLLAAAIVPFLAQAISAPVQLAQAASLQFGLTPAQAAREGLTITSGLTAAFWIYCVLVAALIALCAWMFVPRRPVPPGSTAPAPVTTMG
jgi:hypothetical protein